MSLEGCRVATTSGTRLARHLEGYDSPLDKETHKRYRSLVGKLAWASPIRPDLAYAIKELARGLASPTEEDWANLKHVVRYLKGSLGHRFTVSPKTKVTLGTTLGLEAFADSDWAGCSKTRKSTSGGILRVLGTPVHFFSRTQSVLALSSAEAELYAIGSTLAELLHVRNLLEDLHMLKVSLTLYTDSTSAKSLSARFGTSRKTRHVQL